MSNDAISQSDVKLAIKEALEAQREEHLKELESVKNEYDEKIKELEFVPKVKEEFVKQGGNEKAFNSFYKLNKEDIKDDDLEGSIKGISEEQNYFFGSSSTKINEGKDVDVEAQMKKTVTSKRTETGFVGKTLYKQK